MVYNPFSSQSNFKCSVYFSKLKLFFSFSPQFGAFGSYILVPFIHFGRPTIFLVIRDCYRHINSPSLSAVLPNTIFMFDCMSLSDYDFVKSAYWREPEAIFHDTFPPFHCQTQMNQSKKQRLLRVNQTVKSQKTMILQQMMPEMNLMIQLQVNNDDIKRRKFTPCFLQIPITYQHDLKSPTDSPLQQPNLTTYSPTPTLFVL